MTRKIAVLATLFAFAAPALAAEHAAAKHDPQAVTSTAKPKAAAKAKTAKHAKTTAAKAAKPAAPAAPAAK